MPLPVYFTTRQMFKLCGIDDAQITQLVTNTDMISVEQLSVPVELTQLPKLKITPEDLSSIKEHLARYINKPDSLRVGIDDMLLLHDGKVKTLEHDVWWFGAPQPKQNGNFSALNESRSFRSWYITLRLAHVIYIQQQYAQLNQYCRITECSIAPGTDLWQFLTVVHNINTRFASNAPEPLVSHNKSELWRLRTKSLLVLFIAKTFGKQDFQDDEYFSKTVWETLAKAKIFNPFKLLIALSVIGCSGLLFLWSYVDYRFIIVLLLITFFFKAWLVLPILLGMQLAWMRSHEIIALLTIAASPINHLVTPLAQKLAQKTAWTHPTAVKLVSCALVLAAALCLYGYIAFPVSLLLTVLFMAIRVILALANGADKLAKYKSSSESGILVCELVFYLLVFPGIAASIRAGLSVLFWLGAILCPVLASLNDRFNVVNGPDDSREISQQCSILTNTASSTNYFAHCLFNAPLNAVREENKRIITNLLQDNAQVTGNPLDEKVLDQVLNFSG